MIFVIDDDEIMARCIGRATGQTFRTFRDGIAAMQAIAAGELPTMIFMDVLLDGPDGFTLLNELVSYEDTAQIPVVLVSSLDLTHQKLVDYGVVRVLKKETMRPQEICALAEQFETTQSDAETAKGHNVSFA